MKGKDPRFRRGSFKNAGVPYRGVPASRGKPH